MEKSTLIVGGAAALGLLLVLSKATGQATTPVDPYKQLDQLYSAGKIPNRDAYLRLRSYLLGESGEPASSITSQLGDWYGDGSIPDYNTYLAVYYLINPKS